MARGARSARPVHSSCLVGRFLRRFGPALTRACVHASVFVMEDKTLAAPVPTSAGRRWWQQWEVAALVVLVLGIYFTRLAARPVCGEESRWAGVAREMLASGDFVVPRQQGTIFPERPPLGSWAMAAVGTLRGGVDLVAIRLPSALATLALVLVIYGYARIWLPRFVSFTAAAMYATCGQVMALGRLGESEALFTLFAGGALLVWHGGYLRERSPAAVWSLGYGLAALGALVKGPQAPVYFVAATCGFLFWRRDWRWLVGWGHAVGVLTLLSIVAAWLVPFAVTNLGAVNDVWTGLARDRFTLDGMLKHVASYPFETLGCLLPWSPLLIFLFKPSVRRSILAARPEAKFLLVALAVTYPTVWLAAGARGRYYMPLYPCLAVLMALVMEHCTAQAASLADRLMWRRYVRALALVVVGALAVVAVASLTPLGLADEAAQPWSFLAVWSAAGLAIAGLLVWASQNEQQPRPQVAVVALAVFLALAHAGVLVNTRLNRANDLRPSIAELKSQLSGGELISLGRVYHRFAYVYETPIRQVPWPSRPDDVSRAVTYFCFDHRPGDTELRRSTSDGRSSVSTTGRLPFAWEEVARIGCDPVHRAEHNRTVVIGRVLRQAVIAAPAASRPERR